MTLEQERRLALTAALLVLQDLIDLLGEQEVKRVFEETDCSVAVVLNGHYYD